MCGGSGAAGSRGIIQGFSKITVTLGPQNKDYGILGSIFLMVFRLPLKTS